MASRALAVLATLLLLTFPLHSVARTHRDPSQRVAFVQQHPCPANGKTRGFCPGYVVDHVEPLCAGGRDHPTNMQWQTVADAKAKDRIEKVECQRMRRAHRPN